MATVPHIIFFNWPSTGHMNPTLPVVAELVGRGCTVTYFVPESMRHVVEAAGAEWRKLGNIGDVSQCNMARWLPEDMTGEPPTFPLHSLAWAHAELPGVLAALRELQPSPGVLVYDSFIPFGPLLSHVLGLPGVSFLSMPGPGVVERLAELTEAWEAHPCVDGPRAALRAEYGGFDVLANGLLMEHYSPRLNLVTTIESLFSPPCAEQQRRRFGAFPFTCVGVLADEKVQRLAHAQAGQHSVATGLPSERIKAARAAGSRLLYVSLGTVGNSHFWREPFGPFAEANGLADCTGKQFCQHVFRTCFEALGGDESVLVIMAVGLQEDALEGVPTVPANFEVRPTVPQLEVLAHCDAFVTHGGANSMHEALSYGVPLAVVPMFGDQPKNAETVARCGAGFSFCDPMRTLTVQSLRDAAHSLLDRRDSNSYRAAVQAMKDEFSAAGGVGKAADYIVETVASTNRAFGGA